MNSNQALITAIVVAVSEEYFDDEDGYCLSACRYVCNKLEQTVIANGYEVPQQWKGGCEEDWGMIFECRKGKSKYIFDIGFFALEGKQDQNRIIVQFYEKTSRVFGLLSKRSPVSENHSLQLCMRDFSKNFTNAEFYSENQLTGKGFNGYQPK